MFDSFVTVFFCNDVLLWLSQVCGCDGTTYLNACYARFQGCNSRSIEGKCPNQQSIELEGNHTCTELGLSSQSLKVVPVRDFDYYFQNEIVVRVILQSTARSWVVDWLSNLNVSGVIVQRGQRSLVETYSPAVLRGTLEELVLANGQADVTINSVEFCFNFNSVCVLPQEACNPERLFISCPIGIGGGDHGDDLAEIFQTVCTSVTLLCLHVVTCTVLLQQVCGCDGKSHINACVARFVDCVSSWTPGGCASQQPVILPGQRSCEELGLGQLALRVNAQAVVGNFFRQNGIRVEIIDSPSVGWIVTWFSEVIPLNGAIVQDRSSSYVYRYDPVAFSDGMHSPNASSSLSDLTFIEFCSSDTEVLSL